MSGIHQSKKTFKKWRPRGSDGERSRDKDSASELFPLTFKERVRWPQWSEAMVDEAKLLYGLLGQSLHQGKYVELPAVEGANYDLNNKDAEVAKMNRMLMLAAAQNICLKSRLIK